MASIVRNIKAPKTFVVEMELEKWLIDNLDSCELGLRLVAEQFRLYWIEPRTRFSQFDILAKDAVGRDVIIEVKRDTKNSPRCNQQLASYRKHWIENYHSIPRLILASQGFSKYALQRLFNTEEVEVWHVTE